MPPVLILRSDGELVEEPGPEDDAEIDEDDILEVVRGQPTTAPPLAARAATAPLTTVPPAWVEDLVDEGAVRTADLAGYARSRTADLVLDASARTADLALDNDHPSARTADLALDTAPPAPRAREHSFARDGFGPEDFGPDAFGPEAFGSEALAPNGLGADELDIPEPLPASAYLGSLERLALDESPLEAEDRDGGHLDARALDTAPPYVEQTAPLPPSAYLGTPASARAPMAPASWGDPEPRAASMARTAVGREPSTTRVAVSLEGPAPRGLSAPLSAPAIPAPRAASSGGVPSATRSRSISSVSVSVTGVGEREDGRAAPRRSVSAVGRARPIKERDRRSVEPAPAERDAHAERAAQLYQQALEQVRAGQHGPALSTMRLALSYAPSDIRYAEAYRKLQKHLGASGTPDTSGGG
jgi:hypothetical protein